MGELLDGQPASGRGSQYDLGGISGSSGSPLASNQILRKLKGPLTSVISSKSHR